VKTFINVQTITELRLIRFLRLEIDNERRKILVNRIDSSEFENVRQIKSSECNENACRSWIDGERTNLNIRRSTKSDRKKSTNRGKMTSERVEISEIRHEIHSKNCW
jgi:hypothetical protein